MYGYYSESLLEQALDFIGPFISIVVGLIVLIIIIRAVKSKGKKGTLNMTNVDSGVMGMRGRTREQKNVIKYFNSTGILGAIFRISNDTFDGILNNKVREYGDQLDKRALAAHGMDADEVKEIPPIRVENYFSGSRYFKMFRDNTFRASEYQMSYLMFSEKQLYAYSHTFDLTSANTTEQTREYFYEDITSIDVTKKQIEFPDPRPLKYIFGGIGVIVGSLILGVILFIPGLIAGIFIMAFLGYSRSVVDNLVLRLTVSGDEFVCAMRPENMAAIQGMKAKIREKKQ